MSIPFDLQPTLISGSTSKLIPISGLTAKDIAQQVINGEAAGGVVEVAEFKSESFFLGGVCSYTSSTIFFSFFRMVPFCF